MVGSALAPRDNATFDALQSKRPLQSAQPIPPEVLNYRADSPLRLDRDSLVASLRTSSRGSSAGPGGCTYEHLRCVLDDPYLLELFCDAMEELARAEIPADICSAITMANMTALQKRDGGIRGIAAGSTLRRLVAKTLARQFGSVFDSACAPFQYALSTRAGTDCVGHAVRFLTDSDPKLTVLGIDGIGAYDNVLRASMLGKLLETDAAPILPFVLMSYGQPSEYRWVDRNGESRSVRQAEGGEQGDPLMPALFSLGIHNALEAVNEKLDEGEFLFAFLDDVYAVAMPDRIRTIFDLLAEELRVRSGISLHLGKTRTWNKAGIEPKGMSELGNDIWSPEGIRILGIPIGTEEFVSKFVIDRLEEEARLWKAIPTVQDLQCAWQLLLQSASPRFNHMARTLPPSMVAEYARGHDDGI